MKLSKLLERMDYQCIQGTTDIEMEALVYDTRKAITPNTCFVCITGSVFDGHDYATTAAQNGATAIIVEKMVEVPASVTVILVSDTRKALAITSAAYFGYPADQLRIIGITGTKGKTTSAYMVYSILQMSGIKTGLIGTVETIIGEEHIPSSHTTPESYILQEYFAKMVAAGLECVVMEVSSQGLKLYRVYGFQFEIGVLTNLERDHISPTEHPDFEDYLECKGRLFRLCKTGIVNHDDSHTEEALKNHNCAIETYGVEKQSDLQAINVNLHHEGGFMGVEFDVKGLMNFHVKVGIPGKFSVYNAMTAIAICRHFNIDTTVIQKSMEVVTVRGRVEPVKVSEDFIVLIDYAHNAMSLKSLLTTMLEYKPKRLVCMFGCGGNRSKDRRFEMGEISSSLADLSVVTSDNPRYEDPELIIQDILVGIAKGKGNYIAITDRKEAIRYCITNAEKGDVIIIAGKGHEDYQEICGVKHPMDDRILIREVMNEIGKATA